MNTSGYWQNIQHQRFTRRKMLALTGASGAGLAIAAACGGDGDAPTPTSDVSAGTPVAGGRLFAQPPLRFVGFKIGAVVHEA